MTCPICRKEHCVCDMRIGLAAAVLGTGEPIEIKALHRRYRKYADYEQIITAARKLAYSGQAEMLTYLASIAEGS